MQGKEIRPGDHFLHIRGQPSVVRLLPLRDPAAVAQHLHAEAVGHARHPGADLSHSDDAEDLSVDVVSVDLADHVHLISFGAAVVCDGPFCQHEDQADGVFRHRVLVGFPCVADLDPAGRGLFHVDPVDTDPVHRDHLQLRARVIDPGGELSVPRQGTVTIRALPDERLLIGSGSVNQLITLFLQKAGSDIVYLFGYQYLVSHLRPPMLQGKLLSPAGSASGHPPGLPARLLPSRSHSPASRSGAPGSRSAPPGAP